MEFNAENEMNRKLTKQPVTGSFRMKRIRSLLVVSLLCLFVLIAAAPPLLAASPVVTIPSVDTIITGKATALLHFQLKATDADVADTIGWTVAGLPAGATINRTAQPAIAGLPRWCDLSWTPTRDDIGNHVITFTATDNGGNTAVRVLTVTVQCNPPVITEPIVPVTFAALVTGTFDMIATTVDGADVTWDIDTAYAFSILTAPGPAFTNLAGTDRMKGHFSWTPAATQIGYDTVRFIARDSCDIARDTSARVILHVTVANPVVTLPAGSTPYTLVPSGTLSLRATDTVTTTKFHLGLSATDPVPTGDVTWTIDLAFPQPGWATFTDSGAGNNAASLTGVPACADAGTDTVRFIATDPIGTGGGALADTIDVIFTILPGNPVAGVIGSHDTLDVTTTKVLAYTLTATDPNTFDDVVWSVPTADTLGTGLHLTDLGGASKNATLAWTPGPTQGGVYQFHFIATDNSNANPALCCADTELVTIIVSSSKVLAVVYDTIPKNATNKPLLKFKVGIEGDTLTQIKIRSYVQKEFAVSKITVWKNSATSPFGSYTLNGRYDLNYEKTITGLNIPFDTDDTITVKVDCWADSIDSDTTYHMTGLEVVIPPDGMVVRHNGVLDSLFSYYICNTVIDSTDGQWLVSPNPYRLTLDIYPPIYDIAITVHDSAGSCPEVINLNDTLIIQISNANEWIKDSTINVDLSQFGLSATYKMRNDAQHFNRHASTDPADFTWTDTVKVGVPTPPKGLDFDTGYWIYFTATDMHTNVGTVGYQFNTRKIDTIRPQKATANWLRFYLSENNVGDSSAAIGDRLTVVADLGPSGYFEITSVSINVSNFLPDSGSLALEDVTNGNNLWRKTFLLNEPTGAEYAKGTTDTSSVHKYIWITAIDNACNRYTDSIKLDNALDLKPPTFSGQLYVTRRDYDSSNATNLGDSVGLRVDLRGNTDIDSVWADFKEAGLGGLSVQQLYDNGTNGDTASADKIWMLGWRIGKLMDPTYDPDPSDAKDAEVQGSLPADADYRVKIFAKDKSGIVDSAMTSVLTRVQGGSALLDTRRPTEIDHNFVQILQLAGGKLQLKWPRTKQAEDAKYFYVFVDSTGSGFDFTKVFGTTLDREYGVDTNAWTSEVLSSNKTYRFVLRTKDNAGNWELNTTNYLGIADGQAPWACVVYPDTGMYWGHDNPLMITATTTFTDLDAAWIYYRKTDLGGGIPGPWTRYTPNNMYVAPGGLVLRDTLELPQSAQYKGRYEFYIIAQDKAGNILPLDSAKAHCPAFTFYWDPNTIQADFLAINGSLSPQSLCGFNVWRDSLNTAKVTVVGGDTSAAIYTIDSWVLFYYAGDPTVYDSVRIEYKDLQKIPFTYSFSVNDWPKSGSAVTDIWVSITNTRNGAYGIASVHLCVPDVKAPDIRMTYPTAYSRVPIAKSSLNRIPVRAKIVSTSYDPTLPVRMEFFYQVDGTTDWVKIGETGAEGANGYEVLWDDSKLAEGWVWLKAKVTDNANNTKETPLIKVFLDKTAPIMTLTIPDAIMVNGGLVVRDPGEDYFINLNAEITNTTIDIAEVEFFISYRDSVDLVKYYHSIGVGYPALNNSIWRYEWYINEWADWMKCGYDYKLRIKVTDIAGNVYDDQDGDGQFDDYTFWANPFTSPINLNTPADGSKILFKLDCGAPQVAIDEVTSGDRTYQTPSSKLGGPAIVYMKRGETVGVKSVVLDSLNDLTGVKQVEYFFKSPVFNDAWKSVGVATTSPWTVSFDPFALGLISKDYVFHNEYHGGIKAVLTDSLNQTNPDEITMIVLDTVPGIAAWKTPTHTYVWGSVDLSIWSLEGDYYDYGTYRYVTYKYKPAAGGDWVEIATVRRTEGGDTTFYLAQWPTLNNLLITDGSYILGFETQDQNLNVKPIDQNPTITVIVQNALPTATITSPSTGAFFCYDQYFTADVTNGPVGYVDFEYKPVLDDPSGKWTPFTGPGDNFAPWGKMFPDSLADGFYRVRVLVTNQAGRTWYSEPITLFFDGTNPLARIIQAQPTGGSVSDLELGNDGCYKVKRSYKTLNITAVAFDSLSPMGSQAMYNSGIDYVSLNLTYLDGDTISITDLGISKASLADSGRYAFTWDISGLPTGRYEMTFQAFDKAGCGVGTDTRRFRIIDPLTPPSLVAGFWQPVPGEGKIVGVTYADETVQFQYKTNGDWIPIGIGTQVASKSLFYPESRWQDYGVYVAPWAPSDGTNYQLRLVTAAGDDYAPILSVTIAGGVMTVTSNPTTGWGPGTIEKNQEDGCNLEGVARFASTFGFPFAVSISMDLDDLNFEYELIDFRNLPQQTPAATYAGPFQFYEMQDGGPAWGQVFFCDNVGTVGYSYGQHLAAYWITKDLGSGGPITYVSVDLKDTTTVTIPPEWTDDREGYGDALVVWETTKPAQCVVLDWLLTPVGNRSGFANYVGAPGQNCDTLGNVAIGDDERYAIIKMTYDATCNVPQESLMVAWWDGEGDWLPYDIYFPSTVAGFNTTNHTVEFAATVLHGTFAVIKRTPYTGMNIVTRKDAFPMCDGYTNGRPVFWYQFTEAFTYVMDWSTLEVKVDGILVYEGGNYYVGGVKVAPSTALDGTARRWDIDVDEVSAVVSVHYRPAHEGVLDDPLPLDCGSHTIWIGARDHQGRLQYLNDPFMVDCTKPVVTFPNSYVGKDPTIRFTITDDLSGVEWDSVYADVFFITKSDSADYYGDYYTKERVAFIQSFFPGQIENYLSGNTVTIPTSYNLENVRAMIVVVYNGHRRTSDDPNNWGIDPTNNYFSEYYLVDGGAPDCVGNNATPHVQYFTVDSKAPSIVRTSTTTACPMVFTVADDGSGISAGDIVIRENGTALGESAKQSTASAVNGGGKWFFAPSGGGGVLYYCQTAGVQTEISITDATGNEGVLLVLGTTIVEGDLTVTMSNNPFDPTVEPLTLYIALNKTATVTAKIYDMGGDLVRTLSPMVNGNLFWDGKTDGGTTIVANGVYLAHIVAEGSGGSVSTVVKIAVVKK